MRNKSTLLVAIKHRVLEIEPDSEVILYGSRARGEAHQESDWDILILTPQSTDLRGEQQFRHQLFELELEYGQAISTTVHSKSDWEGKLSLTPLYHNISQEGIRI
ncbi:MAG: nucleotidyltransferase domain-containing protein [Bacteroidota bacterium]